MAHRLRWPLVLSLILTLNFGCAGENGAELADLPDEVGHENPDRSLVTPEVLARGFKVMNQAWTEPTYSDVEQAEILKLYEYIDPNGYIPKSLFKKSMLYFHRNRHLIPNQNYMIAVDFSPHSRDKRMYLINLKFGYVGAMHMAHGKGSDTDHDGVAEAFGNEVNSHMSSLGPYLTAETYEGKHGYSLRIDGLRESNSRARERAVVIHGANYVADRRVRQGRSLGCFVVSFDNRKYLIDRVRDGALLYAGI